MFARLLPVEKVGTVVAILRVIELKFVIEENSVDAISSVKLYWHL